MPGIALVSHFIIRITPGGWYYPHFIGEKIGSEMYGSKVTQLLNDRIGTETEAVQGPNLTCAHSTVCLLLLRMRPWGLELFPMKDQIVILGVCFLLVLRSPVCPSPLIMPSSLGREARIPV